MPECLVVSANVGGRLAELKSVATALKSEGYTHIGLYGFCWGGKVATAAAGEKDLFKSVAIVHPAMLDVKDVDAIEVPFAFYPSKVSDMTGFHGFR
jgi:dienelactone hydrolase